MKKKIKIILWLMFFQFISFSITDKEIDKTLYKDKLSISEVIKMNVHQEYIITDFKTADYASYEYRKLKDDSVSYFIMFYPDMQKNRT